MTTSSANPKVEAIRRSVQESYEELNQLIDDQLAELETEKLYQTPTEGEWSIMQNLAHIAEFMPYWAGEIEKLLAKPGQNFGRTMQHEGRLQFIRDHETDSLVEIQALLPGSYERLMGVLGNLKDSDLELAGIHSRYGEKPLEWFIEEFITQHLKNHLEQIRVDLIVVG